MFANKMFSGVQNEKGSSMITMLLVSGVVVGGFMFATEAMRSSWGTTQEQTRRSACEDLVQSSLNNFRALGMTSQMNILMPGARNIDPAQTVSTDGLASTDRWPTTAAQQIIIQDNTATPPELYGFQLLEGGITALNSILNKQTDAAGASYCGATLGGRYVSPTTPALLVEEAIPGAVENPNTSIRIQLVNLSTGQISCPTSYPFYVRPAGTTPTTGLPYRIPANSSDVHGLRVTVTTQYTDPRTPGQRQNCSATADFSYPVLKDPQLNASNVNFAIDTPRMCQTTPVSGRVTVAPPSDVLLRGQILLCRDYSSSGGGPRRCAGGVSPQNFSTSNIATPCDRAKLCGREPASVRWIPSGTYGFALEMTYNQLPWNCQANMEVVAVDPAYNRNETRIGSTGRVNLPACNTSCPSGWTLVAAGCPSANCSPPPPPPPPPPEPDPSAPTNTATGPSCTPGDVVCEAYVAHFGRPPDAAGAAFWNATLAANPGMDLNATFAASLEASCIAGDSSCTQSAQNYANIQNANFVSINQGNGAVLTQGYADNIVNNVPSCGYGDSAACGADYLPDVDTNPLGL
ncbi:MAG: hypothetical protein KF799_09955 [Bdellovibrionales bacterium]|nr:hypothetical protein [Bdellovibrionales bacterium]